MAMTQREKEAAASGRPVAGGATGSGTTDAQKQGAIAQSGRGGSGSSTGSAPEGVHDPYGTTGRTEENSLYGGAHAIRGNKMGGSYTVGGFQIGGAKVQGAGEPKVEGPASIREDGKIEKWVPVPQELFEYNLERARAGNTAAIGTLKHYHMDAQGNPTMKTFVDDIDERTGKPKMSEREQLAVEVFSGEGLKDYTDVNIDRTEIDKRLKQQDQVRKFQMLSMGMAGQAARGDVPSVAEMQGRAQMDQALSQQFAMASSARGGTAQRMAAQRGAFQNVGIMSQQASMGAQMMRAQEMAMAREQFAAQASGIRSQDFAVAQFEGGISTNAAQMGLQNRLGLISQMSGIDAATIQAQGMQGDMLMQQRNLNFQKDQAKISNIMGGIGAGLNVASSAFGL